MAVGQLFRDPQISWQILDLHLSSVILSSEQLWGESPWNFGSGTWKKRWFWIHVVSLLKIVQTIYQNRRTRIVFSRYQSFDKLKNSRIYAEKRVGLEVVALEKFIKKWVLAEMFVLKLDWTCYLLRMLWTCLMDFGFRGTKGFPKCDSSIAW